MRRGSRAPAIIIKQITRTRPRAYLGTVGAALAIQAALLAGASLLVLPLALLAWSWNNGDLQATTVAVGLGLIGYAWTTIGVSLIPLTPGQFALPGCVWIALALLIAGAAQISRRRASRGL